MKDLSREFYDCFIQFSDRVCLHMSGGSSGPRSVVLSGLNGIRLNPCGYIPGEVKVVVEGSGSSARLYRVDGDKKYNARLTKNSPESIQTAIREIRTANDIGIEHFVGMAEAVWQSVEDALMQSMIIPSADIPRGRFGRLHKREFDNIAPLYIGLSAVQFGADRMALSLGQERLSCANELSTRYSMLAYGLQPHLELMHSVLGELGNTSKLDNLVAYVLERQFP